ncbi:helix-turn-helix domain-containing protein [Rikenella microfusus]|nr:helix-turn-helix domain-containing protein [Rikenella microfusus]
MKFEEEFSLFVVSSYFCNKRKAVMEQTDFDGIVFADTLQDFNALRYARQTVHILCCCGNMGFTFQDTRYNIAVGDYVILPNAELGSGFSASDNFRGILMSLSEAFVASIAIRSNYGIIGHLSLLQNPVMKLSARDFRICEAALLYLRMRMEEKEHLFREELLGSLLTAHILDLYDIHARSRDTSQLSEHIASQLRKFIELLYNGEYMRNRDLDFYASRLCITPHYLSEICRKVSGRPATYWIDRFTIQEITRLLRQKELPLTTIAERMNFSSVSYFSRYVQKRIGMPPSEYRNNLTSKQFKF